MVRPSSSTYHAVNRSRTLPQVRRLRLVCGIAEPVAYPAHRLQEGAVKATVNLAPQIADVDIDNIGIAEKVEVPDVLGNLRAGEHMPGMTHEIFQEGELPRAQLDQAPAT